MTTKLTIGVFCHYFVTTHNFDPNSLFCSITGARIGNTLMSEIEAFIDSQPDADLEELADDYLLRLVASMRPSIHWNVMREDSLDLMRKRNPVATFAYCFNRLTSSPEFRAIPFSERTTQQLDRIANYAAIEEAHESRDASELSHFDKMLHMLIEVDSFNDLSKQPEPFSAIQWREASPDQRLQLISDWYAAQCKLHAERVDLAKRTANWIKHGNPLMSRAAASLARELGPKPEKILARNETARNNRRRTNKDSKFFDAMLDSLMAEADSPKPAEPAKPATPAAPAKFKLKLNLGVKS